ncbi:MAG: hypothetical protein MZW92_49495 [Comamonadaceae bacterium]|nr:hypothetical protein [Comamonadaceae bacterium]
MMGVGAVAWIAQTLNPLQLGDVSPSSRPSLRRQQVPLLPASAPTKAQAGERHPRTSPICSRTRATRRPAASRASRTTSASSPIPARVPRDEMAVGAAGR